ncbi:MAG: RluA family pseudouridine synthase [Coprobacillus sp.]|nr:RluA family pseudouridine synthase [Coprobacillus sp.]
MNMREFTINSNEEGQTLEKYIRKLLVNAPLSFIYKTFRKEDIKINGKKAKKEAVLHKGDKVSIYISEDAFLSFLKSETITPNEYIKPWIIYEDDNILIVNKPKGILVVDDRSEEKSLTDMTLEYLYAEGVYDPTESPTLKPGPAHRLDRNTSGLVVFGKNVLSLQALLLMMKDKSALKKKYYALVKGIVDEPGIVDVPLLKDSKNNTVYVSSLEAGGKRAQTRYVPLSYHGNYTLLDITLLTGRTHQIRVHMAYISHPVVGDSKYGDFDLNRLFKDEYHLHSQFLEAYELTFTNPPDTLNYLKGKTFTAPMDEEYMKILEGLDENSSN